MDSVGSAHNVICCDIDNTINSRKLTWFWHELWQFFRWWDKGQKSVASGGCETHRFMFQCFWPLTYWGPRQPRYSLLFSTYCQQRCRCLLSRGELSKKSHVADSHDEKSLGIKGTLSRRNRVRHFLGFYTDFSEMNPCPPKQSYGPNKCCDGLHYVEVGMAMGFSMIFWILCLMIM